MPASVSPTRINNLPSGDIVFFLSTIHANNPGRQEFVVNHGHQLRMPGTRPSFPSLQFLWRHQIASMFSWMKRNDNARKTPQVFESVVDSLKNLYFKNLKPLEDFYQFSDFHSPSMTDPDFGAKPMVLLVGQYSTGKTTFIKYLLESDFPGIRIGPEPTTDSFITVMHGERDQVIPGNALIVDPRKQFRPLSSFGNAFLNRFNCSEMSNPVLESITIVDTPGMLSGEKQSVARGYDFTEILRWFAERCDRIILLFDAHKLDISDEFQRGMEVLREYEEKIRIVLNKADKVTTQQLMRVYGALMWSLGKEFNTPEVARVYIGSFWDQPLEIDDNRKLFEMEANDLFKDIQSLPKNAALRKLNDFIKRARLAKVNPPHRHHDNHHHHYYHYYRLYYQQILQPMASLYCTFTH